jgi:predicted metal-dependent HD superfamily phosphohydrolase
MKEPIANNIVDKVRQYVYDLLNSQLSKELCYHSINHTQEVIKNAELIAGHVSLNPKELNILRVSALFHDVGFIEIYKGHEEISKKYATDFLRKMQVSEPTIERVGKAILATKVPQNPHDLISSVLCDADLMYLSDKENILRDIELLRQEWKNCGLGNYSKIEFLNITHNFFKEHHYHTEYGKNVLTPKKKYLKKMLLEMIMTSK